MKTKPGILILLFLAAGALVFGQKYSADWQSLRNVQTTDWLQKGKFGIYTHWEPYAVHAFGSNTSGQRYHLVC